jgi:hypothetical protein
MERSHEHRVRDGSPEGEDAAQPGFSEADSPVPKGDAHPALVLAQSAPYMSAYVQRL